MSVLPRTPSSRAAATHTRPVRAVPRLVPAGAVLVVVLSVAVVAAFLSPALGQAAERPNRAPVLDVVSEARAILGDDDASTVVVKVGVSDPDGDPVRLRPNRSIPGLRSVRVDGIITEFHFEPRVPGTWVLTLTALDDSGATTTQDVAFLARHPAEPGTLLALGDSVGSGHGRDLLDYLGGDDCWRSESQAYGRRAFNTLAASGELGSDPQFELLACSGATTLDLTRQRHDGSTQIERAVDLNPGVVTLTVGANDINFDEPWNFVTPDDELNAEYLEDLLATYENRLDTVLRRLVERTDADVVLTTYYNPAAQSPQGIRGCRRSCFLRISNAALDRLNETIFDVVDEIGSPKLSVADIRTQFQGHGAPNGFGPDGLREDGVPVIRDIFGRTVEGTHPYCARGRTTDDTWVSRVDCVHPNGTGHRRIGTVVSATVEGMRAAQRAALAAGEQ